MKSLLAVSVVGLAHAETCSFSLPGGKGCDVPEVKPECCDLLKLGLECAIKNHNQPKAMQQCVMSQKARLMRDMRATGGQCPGLQNAKSHMQEYCHSSMLSSLEDFDLSMEFVAAETCSFSVPGGKGCDIPDVKPPCCDLFKLGVDCAIKNQNQPKAMQQCMMSQKARLMQDMQAAGGQCPGLQKAQAHLQEYCHSSMLSSLVDFDLMAFAAADTCSFSVPGGKGCDIPDVKPPCCDLLKLGIDCVIENQNQPKAVKQCVMSQKARLMQDMQAAGGQCPGLQKAKAHMQEYCHSSILSLVDFDSMQLDGAEELVLVQ